MTNGVHAPDTGTSPEPGAVLLGRSAETAEHRTYRVYLDHRPGCHTCSNTPGLCDTGRALWDAYKAASR